MTEWAIIFVIGAMTGVIDGLTGIGGLFSIPLLILTGLPPHIAVASDRFGGIGVSLITLWHYKKAGQVLWRWTIPLATLAILGALIGAKIIVSLDPDFLKYIIATILVITVPFLYFQKDLGVDDQRHQKNKNKNLSWACLLFFIGGL